MDLQQILDLVRDNGNAVYTLVATGAFWNSMLMPLFAGYAVQLGALEYWPTVAAVFAGGVVGDEVRFWLSRRFGPQLFDSMPRLRNGIQRAARVVDKHHWWMMFVYRYPHGIRGLAGFAFGLSTMPRGRFLALNLVSAAIWSNLLVGIGYGFAHVSDKALGAKRRSKNPKGRCRGRSCRACRRRKAPPRADPRR
jgi:membrane protein DedA with SNARE-associated domain